MAPNYNDDNDFGRHESENMLRNKTNSKYLDDLVEESESDFNECTEMIERDKAMCSAAEEGFLSSLDLSMHDKHLERTIDRRKDSYNPTSHHNTVVRQAKKLVDASDDLVKLSSHASSIVSEAASAHDSHESFETVVRDDKKYVKSVLASGKRVVEGQMGEGSSSAGRAAVDDEAEEDAKDVFLGGQRGQERKNADVESSLKYVEKGVKKMMKGMDPDV